MPMLKTITGHTGCAGVMDYLRKGSKDDRRKRRMGEISEADTLRVAAKGIAGYLHDGHGAEFDRAEQRQQSERPGRRKHRIEHQKRFGHNCRFKALAIFVRNR